MEQTEEIKNLKERLEHWERTRDDAEMEAQKCRKRLRELDEKSKQAIKKAAFRRALLAKTNKQDQIVHILRQIGKTTTAGPICVQLKKHYGVDVHNSEFAAKYLEVIKDDDRVVVRVINATKNEYSLKEWGGKK